ncbi:hypothetical protein AMD00_05145 [Viridibacillus arvi]|uniref:DUF2178 domain-containing protein n=1 Tax=Viridibacillus arvi TaxID=263475 RepID=A0A0M0LLN5_9BACL|nr:hypothetical protein AMD00_05145 [Viridibacillus arvi]
MIIFDWLDSWLASDIMHFNLFVGTSTILSLIAIIIFFIIRKKIASKGENSFRIYFKITSSMYISLLILVTVYMFWVPAGTLYSRQYINMSISLSFFIGAISSIYYYRKAY